VIRIALTVSPGAARSEIVGRHGDGWKVRVAAAPDRGRANDALVEFLAETLRLPQNRVRISSGYTSRRKLVEVDGLDEGEIERRLDAAARAVS
jgi:uncharacterized protein (TIGR00251 family)